MTWMCQCGAASPCEKCKYWGPQTMPPSTGPNPLQGIGLIAGKTREQWRYEFAGRAMQGLLANPDEARTHKFYAETAVLCADALIAALSEGKP